MADKRGIGTFVNEAHEMASDKIDLFNVPPIESAIIHGKTLTIYPRSVMVDSGPFEFTIPPDGNDFTALNMTRLEGELEVTKPDGTALADTDANSIVNMFPHSIFKQVECTIGNGTQIVDLSTPTYHLKSFIESHLTYDSELKKTTLAACEMYHKDDVGKENDFALTDTTTSFVVRKKKYIGKKLHFSIILHIDFFQCPNYLIPNCEVRLKLIRAEDTFSILGATMLSKIKVNSLKLKVRRITLDPNIASAIESRLATTPAIYPIVNSKITNYLINSGVQSTIISQAIRGKIPRSFLVTFLNAKAYDNAVNHNPFCFQHFGLNQINAHLNGEPILTTPFYPKWEDFESIEQYRWLLDNIGLQQNASNGITFEEFKSNTTFFAFDLSPDLCNSYYLHGIETGTIDLHLGFKTALTDNIMCIIYASYDEIVTIDKNRNVLIS